MDEYKLQYTLEAPPRIPGLYALKNMVAGMIFIEATKNLYARFATWQSALNRNSPQLFPEGMEPYTRNPADWRFIVIHEEEGIAPQKLCEMEKQAIAKIMAQQPDKLMNAYFTRGERASRPPRAPRTTPSPAARSTITDANGTVMTYKQVAAALNLRIGTVKQKLHDLRKRGVNTMTLEEFAKPLGPSGRPPKH